MSEDTSRTTLPREAVSSWCGEPQSLESSTLSMVAQQMMLPICYVEEISNAALAMSMQSWVGIEYSSFKL